MEEYQRYRDRFASAPRKEHRRPLRRAFSRFSADSGGSVNGERSEADWHCIRFNQKSPVAGCFFSNIGQGPIALPIRAGKVPKDDFPADGGDTCRCRKIFVDPAPAGNVSDVASERLRTSSRLFRLHPVGRGSGGGRGIYHCLYFFQPCSWLSARPALGDAAARFHLFGQHFMEHQRHFA